MTPFEPKGEVAEWRMLYNKLVKLKIDDTITIEQIEQILDRELGQNRSPIYRAVKELEENNRRTLATERGVGYRVAHPREHLGLGLSHSTRARKQLKRGLSRSESADRSKLTSNDVARHEAFESTATRLVTFLGHVAKTVDDHSQLIAEVKEGSEDTSARVAAMEETLKRHGLMD